MNDYYQTFYAFCCMDEIEKKLRMREKNVKYE